MAHAQAQWTELSAPYRNALALRNRRSEQRHALPRGLTMRIRLAPGTTTVAAELRNVSKHGVALLSAQQIPPGTYVSFLFCGSRVFGSVRHCSLTRVGYIAGIRVTDVVREDGTVGGSLDF